MTSRKNDLLALFGRVRVKTYFPMICPIFDGPQVMINTSGEARASTSFLLVWRKIFIDVNWIFRRFSDSDSLKL